MIPKSLFASLALLLPPLAHASAPAQPNIIVIMFDDLGVNDLGIYTYPSKANPGPPPAEAADNGGSLKTGPNAAINLTPNIDSLATSGVRMTHFYATEPVCSASRASLMTGGYSRRTRINGAIHAGSNDGLNSTEVTLPELLREQGYRTAMAGKWHLGSKRDHNPLRHGFQRYRGILYSNDMWSANPYNSTWPDMYLIEDESQLTTYTTGTGGVFSGPIDTNTEQAYLLEAMTEHSLESIDQAVSAQQPFFLYFAPHAPHVPIHPHPDFLSVAGETDHKQRYLDLLAEMDHRIGQILAKLDDPNGDSDTSDSIADNTLVILTSDNGPWHTRPGPGDLFQGAGSAYPFRGAKHSTWEGGHRVGMLARYPGVLPAGTVLHQTAANMDLLPTLVKLAGGSVPTDREIDGVDIWPLLTGSDLSEPHDYFYFYNSNATSADGVLDLTSPDKFKLIDNLLFKIGTGFTEDFQESTDLSASNPALKTTLAGKINTWNSAMSPRPAGTAKSIAIELENDTTTVLEGGVNSVKVRLSGAANQTVTIAPFSGDPDLSVVGGDTLTFTTSNWNEWQTVTFAAAPDGDDVDSGATFRASAPDTHVREIFVFESDTSSPAPPGPPTGLNATPGDHSILLDWNDNLEADLASYSVYRSTTSGSFGAPLVTGLTASDYTDGAVTPGTEYFYVVSATDLSALESGFSSEVSAIPGNVPPDPLTGLSGTPGPCDIALTWDASTATDFASYRVYRSTVSGSYGAALVTGLTEPDYHDHGTPAGEVFHYVVTAVDLDGNESLPSAELTISAGIPDPGEAAVLLHSFDSDPGAADGAGATVLVDATANGNDGASSGSPVYSNDVALSLIPGTGAANGLSLDLERSNTQYNTVPDSDSLDLAAGGAITIEAWVRLETVANGAGVERQYLVFKKSGATADSLVNYGFLVNSSGSYGAGSNNGLTFLVGDGSAFQAVHSTLTVTDTDWHFVAVRFDDATDTVRFTVDGMHEDITGVTTVPAANGLDLLVGAHTNSSGVIDASFDGKIDELRISNAWLTDDQLLTETPAPADAYSAWIACYNVAGQTAPEQDPDSDGLANLLEFLFDTNPAQANPWPHEMTADAMTVTLRDLAPEDGITVTFESSTDLELWEPRPDLAAPDPDQSEVPAGFTRWLFQFDARNEDRRFVRLAAERSGE